MSLRSHWSQRGGGRPLMATWKPWRAAPHPTPAMPCEPRQDVDTDGSSRLIYYLIKGSRHRWWTASGRAGAWGREEAGWGDRRPD